MLTFSHVIVVVVVVFFLLCHTLLLLTLSHVVVIDFVTCVSLTVTGFYLLFPCRYERIDGGITGTVRQESIDKFNADG